MPAWWKSLTSKIQSKLHKPKRITKTKRSRPKKAAAYPAAASRPHNFFLKKQQWRLPWFLLQGRRRRRRCGILSNVPAPVYVDKLFKDQLPAGSAVVVEKRPPSKVGLVLDDVIHRTAHVEPAGTSSSGKGSLGGGACTTAGDDMWESMGFASPLMRGIDERAEEFIAKFRADMEVQEILARGL